MKIGISISPEMLAEIQKESKRRTCSESHVVREIICAAYKLPLSRPRKSGWIAEAQANA